MSGIESISVGIDTINGKPADNAAVSTAANRDIDLKEHKTTPFKSVTIMSNDLLVAMEPWQVDFIKQNLGRENLITLLGLWGKPVNPHIQDPFGASNKYFDNCFNYIEKSVHEITRKIDKRKYD
jgi:protein-tyrosine-phosphatase